MSVLFNLLMEQLTNLVNTSQYFNPYFSWMVVSYTYFSIGLHGGKIWKYLFYFVSCALIAITIKSVQTISKSYEVDHVKYLNLLWFENIFWGINEWGYLFINFMKIKACISQLNKKFWDIILYSVLVYTIVIRMIITYKEIEEKKPKYSSQKIIEPDSNYNGYYNSALYFPLGIICTLFVYLIIQNLHSEKGTDKRSILSVFLHSTLSRMLFVSLVFIGMSIISFFTEKRETVEFIRILLWRIKGNLGIVFLVDLLLLRIDLDKNKLLEQTRQIKLNNINNIYNGIDLNPTISSVSPSVTQNNNMNMEYTNKLLSQDKSNSSRKSFSPKKESSSNDAQSYMNPYLMENSDISKNNNYNYTTNYSRNKRKNSNISNLSSSFKFNTTPPLPYSNFSYDKPSSLNDSSNYNASIHKVTYNVNNTGIETTSFSTSPYDSMSRLHPEALSIDNINPSTLSSINESLSRSFSQKTPGEIYQDSINMMPSGRTSKDQYQGSLNYSFPENESNNLSESMKNRYLGDNGMKPHIYDK